MVASELYSIPDKDKKSAYSQALLPTPPTSQ